MQAAAHDLRAAGKTIGFVPTMGSLHEGHLSLVRRSAAENAITAVSIFVNPAQFGPKEDYEKYPRDETGDIKLLERLSVDIVFMPDAEEMYAADPAITISVGGIGSILCGASRQGHFNGVATVVAKLFNIVMPSRAYFGQKDFQQTVIIRRLVSELDFDVDVIVCPVVREEDGLAMSSRNVYLGTEDRAAALILYRSLQAAAEMIRAGTADSDAVRSAVLKLIMTEPRAVLEYLEILEPETFKPVSEINSSVVICAAAVFGSTRLIDNIITN